MLAPKYVGRIDARLCPDGRVPAPDAVIDPLVSGGESIKTGDISDVYRVQWAGRDLVVKRYNHVGLLHSVRHTVKGSRARRGWINGQRLLKLGIPTPRPIAYIDEFRGPLLWRSWLITEYVEGPTLHRVLADENVPAGRKRRLVHQALRLIDRLGSHSISHGDMKHTNIRCAGNQVVLTDLDGMEVAGAPWLWRRGRDTARFLWPLRTLPDLDIMRRDLSDPGRDGRDRDKPPFVNLRRGGRELWINTDFRHSALEDALLEGADAVGERFAVEPVPSAPSSRVCRFVVAFGATNRVVYLKEYLNRSYLDTVKRWFRPDRAIRSARASELLRVYGFGAPEVIGVGGGMTGLGGGRSFTATAEIAGAAAIYKYLLEGSDAARSCSLQERRQLLRQFGQTVGRMHRDAIVHGDLRQGNVLVRKVNGRWELFFIDNERTRKWLWLPRRLRLKNLVQVNMLQGISRADRLRFFQEYVLLNPSVRLHYREWVTAVLTVTRRRLLSLERRRPSNGTA